MDNQIMEMTEFNNKFKYEKNEVIIYGLYKVLCNITSPENVHNCLNDSIQEMKNIDNMKLIAEATNWLRKL